MTEKRTDDSRERDRSAAEELSSQIETPQLKGLGTFIALFGIGLIVAVFSVLAWTVGRADYVVLPQGKRFNVPQPQLFWTTAAFALLSTVLMAAAILIGIFKFATL